MSKTNNSSPVPRQDLEAIAVRVRNAHAGVVHATANLLDYAMTAARCHHTVLDMTALDE